MKINNLTIAVAAIGALAISISMKAFIKNSSDPRPDDRGHVFVSQWKEFYDAEAKDRPEKELSILTEIKKLSVEKRAAWDFYEAAEKFVEVSRSRNWKLRDSLRQALDKEVLSFDEPIVTFEHSGSFSAVSQNVAALKAARNEAFYKYSGRISSMMGGVMPEYVENDYEYCLWSMADEDSCRVKLAECLDGRYPSAGYLEYLRATRTKVADYRNPVERKAALSKVAEKYAGKAISFYPLGDLLSLRKDSLDRTKASEDEFKALLKDCESYEKARKALGKEEARIAGGCEVVKSLISDLKDKSVDVKVEDDTISVILKNLPYADIEIAAQDQDKPCFKQRLENKASRFYVNDTLEMALPALDDGEYSITAKNGDMESVVPFESHTLSIASRRVSDGIGIYVTDWKSGEPLKSVDLSLKKNGSETVHVSGLALKTGFTPLPSEISSVISDGKRYTLEASMKGDALRKSKEMTLSLSSNGVSHEPEVSDRCSVFLDRGAYNPGDTVSMKAILYRGDMVTKANTLPAGEKVTAIFRDSESNELEKRELSTCEFGSVDATFAIPEGLRNGMFSIEMKYKGRAIATKRFRVDEFVLPTFDLVFEDQDELFLPGDTVNVRGSIKSYSGHGLSSAHVSYTVSGGGDVLSSGTVIPAGDGSFAVSFQTDKDDDWQYYNVNVKVVDGTGETREYSKGVDVVGSLSVGSELVNPSDGEVSTTDGSRAYIVDGEIANVLMTAKDKIRHGAPLKIDYVVKDEKGGKVASGTAEPGTEVAIDLSALPSGLYKVESRVSVMNENNGKRLTAENSLDILKVSPKDSSLDAPVRHLFVSSPAEMKDGDKISISLGSADGPVWAVAELFDNSRNLLEMRTIHLEGRRGEEGSLVSESFEYRKSYPDNVLLNLFYFKDGSSKSFTRTYHRERNVLEMPLEFSAFSDKAYPSAEQEIRIKTLPDAECLAAVFDKSTETIARNVWSQIRFYSQSPANVNINALAGERSSGHGFVMLKSAGRMGKMMTMERNEVMLSAAPMEADMVEEDSAPSAFSDEEVTIREKFENALTFQPHLLSDKNGNITLKFRTSDKLSTYYVALFAHNKVMKNATIRREMTVTLPVKVSVVEPGYLYDGDSYNLSATVSSSSDKDIKGRLTLYQYDTKDYKDRKPVAVKSANIVVPAGSSVSHQFEIGKVKAGDLGFKLVFAAKDDRGVSFSDGMFAWVPVYPDSQTLTESHSAVLLAGQSRESLIAGLRKSFVNVSGKNAEMKEISILDMVKDAIPTKVEPESENAIALSEAYYMRLVARSLGVEVKAEMPDQTLNEKIEACRNADGGFSWFEGMGSSPVVTAMLLERYAKLSAAGLADMPDLSSAVTYLDKNQFETDRPIWRGGLSLYQYLYIRSLYASVGFSQNLDKEVKKEIKEYLVPSKARGLNGMLFEKTRRLMTLANLSSGNGVALAKCWGISFASSSKIRSSIEGDVISLREYAVDHKDGGVYYPNLVMPWRGILESEAYAHSMLCDLMTWYSGSYPQAKPESIADATRIADGIRIWLMLQKETQKWASTPEFIDAVNSVLSGSDELKATKVIALSETYTKRFADIKATGNGMKISAEYYKDGKKIDSEDVLKVGDKVTAVYKIWNAENRSFVRLTSPRLAMLRPVNQLSGYSGWWSMGAYRNVKKDRTEMWYEVLPEENTEVREDFFVTQSGIFEQPAVEIESLYAPHYRANCGYMGYFKAE